MPLIQWNDNLKVNLAEIDRQHQQLINLINQLGDAMRQAKGKEIMAGILAGLTQYAAMHFATEERYFAQHNYPEAAGHKQQHAQFTQKVVEFKQKFDAGQVGVSVETMNFLSSWLREHIIQTDKKYGPFLIAKGVH